MSKYECSICGYIFDEEKTGIRFSSITECPICAESSSVNMHKVGEKMINKEVRVSSNSGEQEEKIVYMSRNLTAMICKTCGAQLINEGNDIWLCPSCNTSHVII